MYLNFDKINDNIFSLMWPHLWSKVFPTWKHPDLGNPEKQEIKAYIPPERKIPGVGGWCWAMPPTPEFCVGDTNMLVSKMWKFALPDARPPPNLKSALAPTPNPDASQWNIGCVGSQRKMLALAMYISCFLCTFHLCLVPNANPISGWIWAIASVIWHWRNQFTCD